ncbi:hypothetical protein JG688_00016940 [Phytophthora aleatoria]|uniref:Uncharacterized protein n=1 Tax=Phytophthora aleatoria TaxID=2496075 RepID=A0A8J5I7G3_9STRA|nr:hypothetical protein JG688_00016940 [Phytophthora aleatoria]
MLKTRAPHSPVCLRRHINNLRAGHNSQPRRQQLVFHHILCVRERHHKNPQLQELLEASERVYLWILRLRTPTSIAYNWLSKGLSRALSDNEILRANSWKFLLQMVPPSVTSCTSCGRNIAAMLRGRLQRLLMHGQLKDLLNQRGAVWCSSRPTVESSQQRSLQSSGTGGRHISLNP